MGRTKYFVPSTEYEVLPGYLTATKNGSRHFEVKDDECVGCNLCVSVCPVPQCITLRSLKPGEVDARTGKVVSGAYANWTTHPNNPMAASAA